MSFNSVDRVVAFGAEDTGFDPCSGCCSSRLYS